MKGTIIKQSNGNWAVWYITKPRTEAEPVAEIDVLLLHPTDVKQIAEWSKVFDNIDSRILSDPKVEFEIIPCIPKDLEPTRGETLSFESIKYAKLIHDGADFKEWDITLMDGLEDEDWERAAVEGYIDDDEEPNEDLKNAAYRYNSKLKKNNEWVQDFIDEGNDNDWIKDYIEIGLEDEVLIELEDWNHTCGDGCCYTYGTNIYINGEQIEDEDGTNPHQLLKAVLTKLGYTDVKVEYK